MPNEPRRPSSGRGTLPVLMNLTEDERRTQELCIAAGFTARKSGACSHRNPFFSTCRQTGPFVWTNEDALNLQRADAWWFGWHEADDAIGHS